MKRRTGYILAGIFAGLLILGLTANALSGSSTKPAAAPVATEASNPLDSWGPAAEAQIPINFTPDKWNDACVQKLVEATYPSPQDFLDDLHAIGPTGVVSKTGVVTCYIGS